MSLDAQKDLNQRQDTFNWNVRRELNIIDGVFQKLKKRIEKLEAKT